MLGSGSHFFEVQVVEKIFGDKIVVRIVYDISHNIGKIERHEVDGIEEDLIVHSKRATHSFFATQ